MAFTLKELSVGWGKQGRDVAIPLNSTLKLPGFKSLCLIITSFSQLYLLILHLPHLQNGDDSGVCPLGVLVGWAEVIRVSMQYWAGWQGAFSNISCYSSYRKTLRSSVAPQGTWRGVGSPFCPFPAGRLLNFRLLPGVAVRIT